MPHIAKFLKDHASIRVIVGGLLFFFATLHVQSSALAASNQFTIGLSVVSDSIPPSIPTGLTATTISSSQINLSWTASTDNTGVTGYDVYQGTTLKATVRYCLNSIY